MQVERIGAGAVVDQGCSIEVACLGLRAAGATLIITGAVGNHGIHIMIAGCGVRASRAAGVIARSVIERGCSQEVAGIEVHATADFLLIANAVGVDVVEAGTLAIHMGRRIQVGDVQAGFVRGLGECRIVVAGGTIQAAVAIKGAAAVIRIRIGVIVACLRNRTARNRHQARPSGTGFRHALAITSCEIAGLHPVQVRIGIVVAGEAERASRAGDEVAAAIICIRCGIEVAGLW